ERVRVASGVGQDGEAVDVEREAARVVARENHRDLDDIEARTRRAVAGEGDRGNGVGRERGSRARRRGDGELGRRDGARGVVLAERQPPRRDTLVYLEDEPAGELATGRHAGEDVARAWTRRRRIRT